MDKVLKITSAPAVPLPDGSFEYCLSDETKDRYGDVIKVDGWLLDNFKKNPIALFGHAGSFPIGVWDSVRVEAGKLKAKLKLAKEGTSARIDEIRRLVEQGILRATSVGFMPVKREIMWKVDADGDKKFDGYRFLKHELLECSVVSVPANPAALQLAKSIGTSDETMALVFGEQAAQHREVGGVRRAGEQAGPKLGNTQMNPLAKRITDAQERLVALQDQLNKHIEEIGDEPTSEQNTVTEELNAKISNLKTSLDNLREAEKNMANQASVAASHEQPQNHQRPFAVPAKKLKALDYMFRALTVAVKNHGSKQPITDTLKQTYGEDVVTKGVMDIIIRGASVPADTTTGAGTGTTWAADLVQTALGDFYDLLMPASVYPALAARGGKFTFGRAGTISLPSRKSTPTIGGSFVAQGAAIPVRAAAFTSITLTPKKMGVITTMTREIMEHSTPAIEAILRQSIQEDTSVALDSILLDNADADTIRPMGLLHDATSEAGASQTEVGGTSFNAIVADLKGMLGSLVTASSGQLRAPTWIMNPAQQIALALCQNAGLFPFQAEINQQRLNGYPAIISTTVPNGTVILLDAADFFSATGDTPRFDVSDQAVLHMDDSNPGAIVSGGTAASGAVRSLWQTDTMAIRMLLDINWAMRRTGMVIGRTSVAW